MTLLLERLGLCSSGESDKPSVRRRYNGRNIFIITPWGDNDFKEGTRDKMIENGIRPMSIREILKALPEGQVKKGTGKMVFFDTLDGIYPGNYFRIIKIDKKLDMAEIQHCSSLGDVDTDGVPSFSIGLNEETFRGVKIIYNRTEGKLLTLTEAQSGRVEVRGEDVFSTGKDIPGKLKKTSSLSNTKHNVFWDMHPSFCRISPFTNSPFTNKV